MLRLLASLFLAIESDVVLFLKTIMLLLLLGLRPLLLLSRSPPRRYVDDEGEGVAATGVLLKLIVLVIFDGEDSSEDDGDGDNEKFDGVL